MASGEMEPAAGFGVVVDVVAERARRADAVSRGDVGREERLKRLFVIEEELGGLLSASRSGRDSDERYDGRSKRVREERESSSREDRARSEGGEIGAIVRRNDEVIVVFSEVTNTFEKSFTMFKPSHSWAQRHFRP